jgi:hypothetical protein
MEVRMNMVKKLAITTAFLCTVTVANAQDMKLGARVGYNMQMLGKGDYPETPDMGMLGIGAGVVANIPLGPVVLAPEVAFVYRIVSSTETEFPNPLGGTIKTESSTKEMAVSIPVIIKFYPVEAFFLQAGIQLDIPIGPESCSKVGDADEVCVDLDDETVSDRGDPIHVDIGIPLGLGYMISPSLSVDFRFVLGLVPYSERFDKAAREYTSAGSLSTIGLGVTYFF